MMAYEHDQLMNDERCEGYAGSAGDDEPCEVCKACDKLGIEVRHV